MVTEKLLANDPDTFGIQAGCEKQWPGKPTWKVAQSGYQAEPQRGRLRRAAIRQNTSVEGCAERLSGRTPVWRAVQSGYQNRESVQAGVLTEWE